ncbi:hypothetical protein V2J09_006236 [Rumex salicifolius]
MEIEVVPTLVFPDLCDASGALIFITLFPIRQRSMLLIWFDFDFKFIKVIEVSTCSSKSNR